MTATFGGGPMLADGLWWSATNRTPGVTGPLLVSIQKHPPDLDYREAIINMYTGIHVPSSPHLYFLYLRTPEISGELFYSPTYPEDK